MNKSTTPDPRMKAVSSPGIEATVLKIVPFKSDPRVLVITYAADWNWVETGRQFFQAVREFRDRCDSGAVPLPPNVIGVVFDAHASGLEFRMEDQMGPMLALWKFFHQSRIPFAISGSSESVINMLMLLKLGFFLLADSLEEAAGLCEQIGRAIQDKDAESIQRIWGSHRNAFMGRKGRTPDWPESPLSSISDIFLRPQNKNQEQPEKRLVSNENTASGFHIREDIGIAVAGQDLLDAGPVDAVFRESFFHWYDQHPELRDVVVDLAAPRSARDFGVLIFMYRHINARGGHLHLAGPQPGVRSMIDLCRLDRVFDVCDCLEEALAAARAVASPKPRPLPNIAQKKAASDDQATRIEIGSHNIMALAVARETLHDLNTHGVLGGFGPPYIMDLMDEILKSAEHHADWALYFDTQWHICHIHSVENNTYGLYNAADRALRQAELLGDSPHQKCFENLRRHASH